MAISFPYEPVIDAIRLLAQTIWAIPVGNVILEVGADTSLIITNEELPLAIIQLDGEAAILDYASDPSIGHSAKSLTTRFPFSLWYAMATSADERDMMRMRDKLKNFKLALLSNRTLSGAVSLVRLTGVNWSGAGKPWPVTIESGEGVLAGYVAFEVLLTEV